MKKIFLILLVLVLVAVQSGFARAADQVYTVGPGDVLSIKVFGEAALTKDYEVGQDGTVHMPWVREVRVEGSTLREIEALIEKSLGADYLVNPQVTVTVKEFNSRKVYILGAVKNPGPYSLKGKTTVLEALAIAGGITSEGGYAFSLVRGGENMHGQDLDMMPPDGKDVEKTRPGAQIINIDGYQLLFQGNLTNNIALENGDILVIHKTRNVYFDGEIKKPGPVPFEENMTIMRGISLAGGLTANASNKAVVTRDIDGKKERIVVNLKKIGQDPSTDFPLFAGDIVLVKRSIF